MSNQSRQPAGTPVGGEFATGERAENTDLPQHSQAQEAARGKLGLAVARYRDARENVMDAYLVLTANEIMDAHPEVTAINLSVGQGGKPLLVECYDAEGKWVDARVEVPDYLDGSLLPRDTDAATIRKWCRGYTDADPTSQPWGLTMEHDWIEYAQLDLDKLRAVAEGMRDR